MGVDTGANAWREALAELSSHLGGTALRERSEPSTSEARRRASHSWFENALHEFETASRESHEKSARAFSHSSCTCGATELRGTRSRHDSRDPHACSIDGDSSSPIAGLNLSTYLRMKSRLIQQNENADFKRQVLMSGKNWHHDWRADRWTWSARLRLTTMSTSFLRPNFILVLRAAGKSPGRRFSSECSDSFGIVDTISTTMQNFRGRVDRTKTGIPSPPSSGARTRGGARARWTPSRASSLRCRRNRIEKGDRSLARHQQAERVLWLSCPALSKANCKGGGYALKSYGTSADNIEISSGLPQFVAARAARACAHVVGFSECLNVYCPPKRSQSASACHRVGYSITLVGGVGPSCRQ